MRLVYSVKLFSLDATTLNSENLNNGSLVVECSGYLPNNWFMTVHYPDTDSWPPKLGNVSQST